MAIGSIPDAVAAGAIATAESIIRGGGNNRQVYDALKRRYGADYQLDRLSTRFLTDIARRSVAVSNDMTSGNIINPRRIPPVASAGQRTGYWYRVVIKGEIAGRGLRRIVNVTNQTPLTPDQIRLMALDAVREGRPEVTLSGALGSDVIRGRLSNVEVVAIISVLRRV